MFYLTRKQLAELATLASEIKNASLKCCQDCDTNYQKNVARLSELVSTVDEQSADNAFELLHEAKAKIDIAGGIVDWTKEDAEESGEDFFGADICERIESLLTKFKD